MTERYPQPIVDFLRGEPTPEQWTAISWPLEPCVVVAGAGSGKTSVMAARVIYLAMVATGAWPADHEGVMPGNVLCLTFTNKATENLILKMRTALRTLDLDEGEEPEISNYHAFAAQVLERHGMLIGLEPGQRVLSQAQRAQIAARVLDRMTFETLHTRWQPAIVGYILDLDQQLQNHLVEPETVIEHVEGKLDALGKAKSAEPFAAAQERIEIARAVRVFRDLKAELGVIDFGDQIAHAVRIASDHPEVGKAYRERFGAVLLDEYQDTNHAQAVLMRAVFGDGHPVTAVGDPDQNIYAWRGASLWNLLHFRAEFPLPDGTESAQLPLYTNFRSGARILEAADRVIDALPANQRPDPDKLLRPWDRNGAGHVEVARYEHEIAEAEGVAERAHTLHAEGVAWRDMAVLCRTHRLFEALQLAFGASEVPAEFVNLAGLIHLPEVVEVLAYARATDDPRDGVALARILTGPRYRVGLRDLGGWPGGPGERLRVPGPPRRPRARRGRGPARGSPVPAGRGARAPRRDRRAHRRGSVAPDRVPRRARGAPRGRTSTGRRVPRRDHPADRAARRAGFGAPTSRWRSARRRNLAAFLEQVHAFQPVDGELTLRAFLEHLDSIDDDREWNPVQPSEDDSVKVMTVHAAKGLEFEVGVRPGARPRTVPGRARPAEPGTQGELARRRAPTRSRPAAELRRQHEGVHRRPARTGGRGGATHVLRGAHPRQAAPVRLLCQLVRREPHGQGRRAVRGRAAQVGARQGGETWSRPGTRPARRTWRPHLRPTRSTGYRQRFVKPWPGPARPDDADALFPQGWRGPRSRRSNAVASRPRRSRPVRGRTRRVRRGVGRAPYAGDASASAGGGGGRTSGSTVHRVGRRADRLRAVPEALLLVLRPPAPEVRRPERPDRHRDPPLDRDEVTRAGHAAGGRGRTRRDRRGARRDPRQARGSPEGVRAEPLRRDGPALRGATVPPAAGGHRDQGTDRRDLRPPGRTLGGRRLEDGAGAAEGRPARPGPAGSVRVGVHRGLAEDPGGSEADVLLPEDRRGTLLRRGRRRRRATRIGLWLRGIGAAAFEPTPGPQCRFCDFRPFCDAGKEWVAANP